MSLDYDVTEAKHWACWYFILILMFRADSKLTSKKSYSGSFERRVVPTPFVSCVVKNGSVRQELKSSESDEMLLSMELNCLFFRIIVFSFVPYSVRGILYIYICIYIYIHVYIYIYIYIYIVFHVHCMEQRRRL